MTHIRTVRDEQKSWCNEQLGIEFAFKDAESAAINGFNENPTYTPCVKCVDKIIEILKKTG
jgi:hypothetical protein